MAYSQTGLHRNAAATIASQIETALVSDCVFDVPAVWSSTPLAEHFSATVFSCVLAARKPDARLYENAMHQLGVTSGDWIFIGDGGSNELQGARDLGIDAYFLDDQPADQSKVLRVDVHDVGRPVDQKPVTSPRAAGDLRIKRIGSPGHNNPPTQTLSK